MDKLRMQTANKADDNFKKLAAMFPNAVTETINESGEVVRAIDKDVLMQEISCTVVDGNEERYQFTWPDKKKSVLLANAPINKTLRPCREESVDFDTTENLYIEGDNLEVLKLLQETYLGKIKMIYIDPPYNTGNDFVYEDDFAQSTDEYLANSGQFDEDGNRMVQNTESNGRFHTDWLTEIAHTEMVDTKNLNSSGWGSNEDADEELRLIFGIQKLMDYPKPVRLLLKLLASYRGSDDYIVLDFFSGSATTAHATIKLNAQDGGKRKFIMVQLPELTDEKSPAYKAGYKTICEIGKERIRRAGAKIKEEAGLAAQNLDTGFRVLKCDTSNMKDVYYNPAEYEVNMFSRLEDNIKEDRTPEDLLFQVMLDLGVLLSSKIEETTIADKKVFNVEDNYLIACFDSDVSEETIKAIAKQKPYYFVMRDSSMASDSVATNFDQIFATYSPDTVRKVL